MRNENVIRVNGEPDEVFAIRQRILESFKDLTFIEEGHKYYLNGMSLPSVSEITHRFQTPFDQQAQAERYAEKHGETPQYWIDKWRYKSLLATTTGTLVHSYGESLGWLRNGHPEMITRENKCKYIPDKGWLVPTRPKEEAVLKFYDEFPKDLHFVLAETKVYSNKSETSMCNQQFCGTFDLLGYYNNPKPNGKSGLVVLDYKGLPLDTPVFTTDGWKEIGEICEGDKVFDENGKPTTVVHKSGIHNNLCYRLSFDNNTSITADCDHRWKVTIGNEEIVMTTIDIHTYMSNMAKLKDADSINKPKIRVADPIELPEFEYEMDPYILGVMLALIWGEVKEIDQSIRDEVVARGWNETTPEQWHKAFQSVGVLEGHTTEIRGAIAQRQDIIRGAMDVLGDLERSRVTGCYVMHGPVCREAFIIQDILSSLGAKVTFSEDLLEFAISFKCNFNPFLVKEWGAELSVEALYNTIECIDETESVPTCCLEVDSNSHTFCVTHGFLVTHNTNAELTKSYSREHDKMLLPPFTDMWDEPLSLYTLQLSCYALCLRGVGLDVIGLRIIWLKDDGTYELIPLRDLSRENYFRDAL